MVKLFRFQDAKPNQTLTKKNKNASLLYAAECWRQKKLRTGFPKFWILFIWWSSMSSTAARNSCSVATDFSLRGSLPLLVITSEDEDGEDGDDDAAAAAVTALAKYWFDTVTMNWTKRRTTADDDNQPTKGEIIIIKWAEEAERMKERRTLDVGHTHCGCAVTWAVGTSGAADYFTANARAAVHCNSARTHARTLKARQRQGTGKGGEIEQARETRFGPQKEVAVFRLPVVVVAAAPDQNRKK